MVRTNALPEVVRIRSRLVVLVAVTSACATAPGGTADGPLDASSGSTVEAESAPSQAHAPTAGSLVDPIAHLQSRIDRAEVLLPYDSALGYLPGLLSELGIPVSSQGLVFSRTSLQTDRIAPWAPRAIYFNDDVYVGYVYETTFLEIASVHPIQGAVFYTLPQEPRERPVFQRETTTCLMCHESRSITGGVPGLIMLSVLPDRHGYVVAPVHEGPTTDRTAVEKRWGGWYVTGAHAEDAHAGNATAPELSTDLSDARGYLSGFEFSENRSVASLSEHFDTDAYLSQHSDIVALMVLAHQGRVHNLITAAHHAAREALRDQEATLRVTGAEPPQDGMLPATRVRIEGAAQRLLRGMLFVREAPLHGTMEGTSTFAADFAGRGPVDREGRSLRDLDLETRLFRYPLSYMIYSKSFDALPDVVKNEVYGRLSEILEGRDQSGEYDHLTAEDRNAIHQILEDTRPEALRDPPGD